MKSNPFGVIYDEMEKRLRLEFGDTPDILMEAPRYGEVKKLPAIFIEMVDLDPLPSPGTGEVEFLSQWEIRVLISSKQDKPQIVARNASARIATLFNDKVLVPKLTQTANYRGSSDDNFDLKVPLYESWVNYLDIKVRLGEDDWSSWEFYAENLEWDKYLERERNATGGDHV